MILIWILFGMIITLDVIVYGLYRIIKRDYATRIEIVKLMDAQHEEICVTFNRLSEVQSSIIIELDKLQKKSVKKKGMKRGRPRKSGPRKQDAE